MFVPLRDALCPLPDRTPRWLAFAVGLITAIVVAAAATVLFEREAARTARAAKARYWADAYAHRGYPAWVAANPDRACPARLAELDAYVGRRDTIDPWGTTYQFLCGRQHGVVGLRVRSAGPDRQFDSADDVESR